MSNRFLRRVSRLIRLGAILMAVLIVATQVQAGSTTLEKAEPNNTDTSKQEVVEPLGLENPGSIVERLKRDAEPKDYLFQVPGVDGALKPWYDLKDDLDEKYGFMFGMSFTTFYQKASDTFGSEDDAASYDLDFSGTWTFFGRGTGSPTMLGFDFLRRDTLGTEFSPQTLFTQFGSLYSTAAPFGQTDSSVGELWIQQKFRNVFGFRVGQIFPITAYDFFPFKNFRIDFVDSITSPTRPYRCPPTGLARSPCTDLTPRSCSASAPMTRTRIRRNSVSTPTRRANSSRFSRSASTLA